MPVNSNSENVNTPNGSTGSTESIINGALNTQAALSEVMLAYELQQYYHYIFKHDSNNWMLFDPKTRRWREDHNGNQLRDVVRIMLHKYAPDPGPPPLENQALWKIAKSRFEKWNTRQKINAVIDIAETLPLFRERPENFDGNNMLVGLPDSQCWNLATGEIRQSEPADRITKKLGCRPIEGDYRKTLLYERLSEVLSAAYGNEADEVISMILRIAGSMLAVCKSPPEFLFPFGPPGGGKSVLVAEFWRAVFGEYAAPIGNEIVVAKGNQHPEWKLPLEKNRLCINTEAGSGSFQSETLSAVTSGEQITARGMRENSRRFTPKAGLIMCGNALPKGRGGVFRRIRPVRFANPVKEQDYALERKLRQPEHLGIWLLEARNSWLLAQNRPELTKIPRCIEAEIRQYHEHNDLIAAFASECLTPEKDAFETSEKIFEVYKAWCEAGEIKPLGRKTVIRNLIDGPLGFISHRAKVQEISPKLLSGLKNCRITDYNISFETDSHLSAHSNSFVIRDDNSDISFETDSGENRRKPLNNRRQSPAEGKKVRIGLLPALKAEKMSVDRFRDEMKKRGFDLSPVEATVAATRHNEQVEDLGAAEQW